MSSWTAASSDCSRPVNNYVHVKTADLYRPNARLTPERQGYQVLTPFGKLGYSHYSSESLGEADVKGTVNGKDVTFSLTADLGGQSIEVTYTGTLQDDGTLSGQLDLGGYGGGTFTGKKR